MKFEEWWKTQSAGMTNVSVEMALKKVARSAWEAAQYALRATNAAKGPHPDPLTTHSTHDLPEVVAALAADKRRLDRLQAYGHVEMRSFRYYGERNDTYAVKALDDECEGASLRAAIDSVVAAIDGAVEEGET